MDKRSLIPKGGGTNGDVVMTPRPLAKAIIEHYQPKVSVLDPCRGSGAFYDQFFGPPYGGVTEWCEVTEGRDFLIQSAVWERSNQPRHFNWVMSNPPWSQFRVFTARAMAISDNVVWLAPVNHYWLKARLRDIKAAGFAIKEIALVDTPAPNTGWPSSGFQLGAVHIQRGYIGDIKVGNL